MLLREDMSYNGENAFPYFLRDDLLAKGRQKSDVASLRKG
jgi:hypothetical protein